MNYDDVKSITPRGSILHIESNEIKRSINRLFRLSRTFRFVGLALVGKDIVFRFIIEYRSFMDFGPSGSK